MTEKGNILIIEDNLSLQKLMLRLLERRNYRVFACSEAQEAMEKLEQIEPIHLVILDVVLPGISGKALFADIRSKKPDARIILTSGEAPAKDLCPFLEQEGVKFLCKPYNNKEFIATVESLILQGGGK